MNVSVIGDTPFCVLELEMMLGTMYVNVSAVYNSLASLRECGSEGDDYRYLFHRYNASVP